MRVSPRSAPPRVRSRPRRAAPGPIAMAALGLALAPASVIGQESSANPETPSSRPAASKPIELSILTSPPGAYLSLTGESDIAGQAPLDLPSLWTGRYSVVIEGAGASKSQGVIFIPPRGGLAYSLSERPGFSAGLLVRSLNYPGLPAISSRRIPRGLVLAAAGTASIGAGVRAHVFYRNALKDDDLDAGTRAGNYKRARDNWGGYLGAVWGASAVDYWIRSRLTVLESTPSRVTLGAPTVARTGIVWRSVLVPGAGQEFANRSGRGMFWLSAVLTSGAGLVLADALHQTTLTKLDLAERELAAAAPSETAQRQKEVERRRDDVQTAEDLRDGFSTATMIVYVANIFDAFVVPVGRGPVSPSEPKLSARAELTAGRSALAVGLRF